MANIGEITASLGCDIRDFKRNIDRAERELKNYERTTDRKLDQADREWKKHNKTVKTSTFAIRELGTVLAGVGLGLYAKRLIDVGVQLDSLQRSYTAIFRSQKEANKQMKFAAELANKYGVSQRQLEDGYKQIAAAAKGTILEGREIAKAFESVTATAAVLGMSADETSGALRAMSQIISKGKVQAEELRGQLGERLPGAFQIAARAMGKTTQELSKMLEQGEVLSDDFIPAFSRQLEKEFAESAERAGNRAGASFERLKNQILQAERELASSGMTDLSVKIAKDITEAFKTSENGVASFGNVLFQIMNNVYELAKLTFKSIGQFIAIAMKNAIDSVNEFIQHFKDSFAGIQMIFKGDIKEGITKTFEAGFTLPSDILEKNVQNWKMYTKDLKDNWNKAVAGMDVVGSVKKNMTVDKPGQENLSGSLGATKTDSGTKVKQIDLSKLDSALSKEFSAIDKHQQKIQDLREEFSDDYKQTMLSEYEYEKSLLAARYEEYSKYVTDKNSVDQWYNKELAKLQEERNESIDSQLSEFFSDIDENADKIKSMSSDMGWEGMKQGAKNAFESIRNDIMTTAELTENVMGTAIDGVVNAFSQWASGAKSFKDAFKDMARSVINDLIKMITKQLLYNAISAVAGGMGAKQGATFDGSSYQFAKGGAFTNSIVSSPTKFTFANGSKFGEMGEAGPEAVMPLGKTGKGDLGVKIADDIKISQQNTEPPVVNVKNINVLDPEVVGDYMQTDEGEQEVVNIMQKNKDVVQQ